MTALSRKSEPQYYRSNRARKLSFPAKKICRRTILPKFILYTKNYSILPCFYAQLRMKIMVSLLDRTIPAVTQPRPLKRVDALQREALIDRVRNISPGLPESDKQVSDIRGGRAQANLRLEGLDPEKYGSTRNHLDGAVTRLSPYICHGVINVTDVRDRALDMSNAKNSEKFIQQLAWREYWQRLYKAFPHHIWRDVEPYKTGFLP